jgi:hypothetical protein
MESGTRDAADDLSDSKPSRLIYIKAAIAGTAACMAASASQIRILAEQRRHGKARSGG